MKYIVKLANGDRETVEAATFKLTDGQSLIMIDVQGTQLAAYRREEWASVRPADKRDGD